MREHPLPSAAEVARRALVLKHVFLRTSVASSIEASIRSKWADASPGRRVELERASSSIRDAANELLRASGLWSLATPGERELFEQTVVTMTPRHQVDGAWRIVALETLLWTLGRVRGPLEYDVPPAKDLPSTLRDDIDTFVTSARLRATEEIEDAREIAELWHWRSRTRKLIEQGWTPSSSKYRSLDEVVRSTARTRPDDHIRRIDEDFEALGKAYRDLTDDEWSIVTSITIERHHALNWVCGYAPDNAWDETPTDT